jgi:hypothetical protein
LKKISPWIPGTLEQIPADTWSTKKLAFLIPDNNATITTLARRNADDQSAVAITAFNEIDAHALAGFKIVINGFFSHKV